jgi:hypothetical protein
MAEDPDTFRNVLIEQADVLHAQTLWRKHQDRFRKLTKTEHQIQIAENPIPTPAIAPQAPIECAEKPPASSIVVSNDEKPRRAEAPGALSIFATSKEGASFFTSGVDEIVLRLCSLMISKCCCKIPAGL